MEKVILTDSDYIFDDKTGNVIVRKDFIDYNEEQKYYPIHFTDSVEDIVYVYKDIDNNNPDYVILEYVCPENEFITM